MRVYDDGTRGRARLGQVREDVSGRALTNCTFFKQMFVSLTQLSLQIAGEEVCKLFQGWVLLLGVHSDVPLLPGASVKQSSPLQAIPVRMQVLRASISRVRHVIPSIKHDVDIFFRDALSTLQVGLSH